MPTSSSGRGVLPRYAHGHFRARSGSFSDDSRSPPRKSNMSSPSRHSPPQSPGLLSALRKAKLDDEDDDSVGLSRENSHSSTDEFIRQQTLHHVRNLPASKCTHDTYPSKDAETKRSSPQLTPTKADILAKEALESVKKHLQSKGRSLDWRDADIDNSNYTIDSQKADASPSSKHHPGIRSKQSTESQQEQLELQVEREVAAIIIQTYWRRWTAWKLQVRKAAESTMLQRLLGSSGDGCTKPTVTQSLKHDGQEADYIEQATKVLLGLTSMPAASYHGNQHSQHQPFNSQETSMQPPRQQEEPGSMSNKLTVDSIKETAVSCQVEANRQQPATGSEPPLSTSQHGHNHCHAITEGAAYAELKNGGVAGPSAYAHEAKEAAIEQPNLASSRNKHHNPDPFHTSISVGVEYIVAGDGGMPAPKDFTHSQTRKVARSSLMLSTDKLKSILDYLDTADQQADAEAAAILPEDSIAHHRQQQQQQHHQNQNRPQHQQHHHHQQPQPQQEVPTTMPSRPISRAGSRHHVTDTRDDVSVSESSDIGSALSAGNKSAMLAESVFTTFKSKLHKLKEDVKQRDAAIVGLHKDLEALRRQFENELAAGEAQMQHQLELQRQEYEATIARHLSFIDRLLADKDELSKNCHALMEQVAAMQQKQEKAVVNMQEGWAVELKRHKEAWTAAEKIKREQWAEAKTAEIKEITIKGLEHEVQSLLAKQKAEIVKIQDQAADDARRQLDALSSQHEVAIRQLREKMCREQEDLLDRERAATQSRLREAAERYEQQLQSQRLRLVADQDLRMDQLQAQHREERRRLEEAGERTAREAEIREKQMLEDFAREKEAMRRAHDKQLEALQEQQGTQQQGWKDAVLERTRRELAQREAKLREALKAEQEEELQIVIQRLEAEASEERSRVQDEFRQKEQSLVAKHNNAIKELKKSEARLAEKFRQAAEGGRSAEERAAAAEHHLVETRKELQAKNDRLKWFEDQLSKADDKERQHADDIRATAALKEAAYQDKLEDAQAQIKKLSQALERAMKEVEEVKVRRERDMEYLDRRVKATLAKKEERIQELQDKLVAMEKDNRQTAAMLTQLHQDYQLADD